MLSMFIALLKVLNVYNVLEILHKSSTQKPYNELPVQCPLTVPILKLFIGHHFARKKHKNCICFFFSGFVFVFEYMMLKVFVNII